MKAKIYNISLLLLENDKCCLFHQKIREKRFATKHIAGQQTASRKITELYMKLKLDVKKNKTMKVKRCTVQFVCPINILYKVV